MNILGIWDGHDAGAALLIDGRLVARSTRSDSPAESSRCDSRSVDRGMLGIAALRPDVE